MKRAIVLLLAVLMLSSCTQGNNSAEAPETASISETASQTETTAAAAQETTASVIESTAEAETEESEPEPDEPEEIFTIAEDGASVLNLRALIGKDFSGPYYFGGDTVCVTVKKNGAVDIYLVDIARREITGMSTVEVESYYYPRICRTADGRIYMELENEAYEELIVKIEPDGTYEVTAYEEFWVIPDKCGEHILISDGNIRDSESGEVLLATDSRGLGDKSATWYSFACPLDENRFVYYKDGYEWSNGVGVYDFSTHTATDMPDTEGKYFIMAADGKIYTDASSYDYTGNAVYVTDINTSETHLLVDVSEFGDVIHYFAPDNGEYIGAIMNDGRFILIDRDSGDIIREINHPWHYFSSSMFFTDNYICIDVNNKIYMYPRDYSIAALDMNEFTDEDSRFRWAHPCGNDIILAEYVRTDDSREAYFLIIDLAERKVIDRIAAENAKSSHTVFEYEKKYAELSGEGFHNVYKINSDGSYELTDYESVWNTPDMCGSHTIIKDDSLGLVDKESGEVVVKSIINVYDENGEPEIFGSKSDRYHHFVTAIDENRFIYATSNPYYITDMGIYDFETKTTTDFFIWNVLKISGTKIISYESEVDGDGISLYSTDISDMNSIRTTELLNRESFEGIAERPVVYYRAPDDIEYIGVRVYDDLTRKNHYFLIDPDSGEFILELPAVFARNSTFFTDSFICNENSNFLYMINREELR